MNYKGLFCSMENNAQIMEYTQEFRDFLAIAKKCEQTYVGYGNPNADILIIANEPGVKEDLFVEKDLNRNLDQSSLAIQRAALYHRQGIPSHITQLASVPETCGYDL